MSKKIYNIDNISIDENDGKSDMNYFFNMQGTATEYKLPSSLNDYAKIHCNKEPVQYSSTDAYDKDYPNI